MPFEALRNAIVIQAAKDYRKALRALKRNPNSISQERVKTECELFLRSDWYKSICNVNGEMILRELQEEA
ncbi:MAG: hypothetical protein IJJ03_10545 [Mogibacterium sp.]|nr:hypothetical protein [Mogibacterium sp.]MBR0380302.1 hypothetical protein [Mogibacterium sp.]